MKQIKTFLSVLLATFPNIELDKHGVPLRVCPHHLGLDTACRFSHLISTDAEACLKCWSRPS